MDRKKLAETVFARPRALAALEAITHPPIRRAIEAAIRGARARLVVLDAALLQETGADALCDEVWYVACPLRERRRRARVGRGWSEAEHRAREARQWSCRRKRAGADRVIDNGGGRGGARRDVLRALRGIERRS
jgi:dephospho-CoA kinase